MHTFVMKPKGAGFELTGLKNFIWDTLATDIVFGPRGGAYITDWVEGWNVKGIGRIYHVFDPVAMKDPIVAEVKTLLAEGFEKRPPEELIKLLAHRDQRVRQRAQFELADRGQTMAPLLSEAARKNDSQFARIHAIWALGEIADKSPGVLDPILPLLSDRDDEIRAQAARVLGDHHVAGAFDGFVKLLEDPSLRVRYFAAMGLSKLGRKEAIAPILKMARENADRDAYLRHAAVMALTSLNDFDAVQSAAKDDSKAVRMVALLAMRRLEKPQVARFLHDSDPQLVLEAARAINDVPIAPALPQLTGLIANRGLPDYVMLRVINANYRVGTPDAAAALARFAADPGSPQRWRVAALKDLADWQHPGELDRVMGLPRPLPDRDAGVARDAAGPELGRLLNSAPNPVRVAALELIRKLGVKDSALLIQLVNDKRLAADVRESALRALASQHDAKLADAIRTAMSDGNERIRAAAIESMAALPDAAKQIEPLLAQGTIRERQAAFAALANVPGKSADGALAAWMDKLLKGQVPAGLQLDVLEAADKRQSPQIRRQIAQYQKSLPDDEHAAYHLGEFRAALKGGDAAAGDQIFHERADASCLRCHAVRGAGGIVGPALDGIASKQPREYLLESIIYPNAKIAPGFESVIVRLKDGQTVTGIVKKEDDRQVELIDPNGQKITVDKAEIQGRQRGQSAMPEGYDKLLSKRDIRNLVEYLATLK